MASCFRDTTLVGFADRQVLDRIASQVSGIELYALEWSKLLPSLRAVFLANLDNPIGSGYYRIVSKARTASGIYASTFQMNNGQFAQSMRMSLPAD